MKNFIFLTAEGTTFQPNSDAKIPDIENVQVIGFAKGKDAHEAFENLLQENTYLKNTSFEQIFSYELAKNYETTKMLHYLSQVGTQGQKI